MGLLLCATNEFYVLTGTIVCFSGKIGSGKSSVSRAVAEQLGFQRASFGDYVRKLLSEAGGNTESRTELQDLGQSLVQNDLRGFCQGLLTNVGYKPGTSLVIDGIRHVDILDELTSIFGSKKVTLIHLEIGEDLRKLRVELRGDDPSEFGAAFIHPVERDTLSALPKRASTIIDAGDDLVAVVQNCCSYLNLGGIGDKK